MDGKLPDSSSVYINTYLDRDADSNKSEPDFHDVLIDGCREPGKFGNLLRAWLKRDEKWLIARERFSEGWAQQQKYDGSRIVGAANMFDLLPDEGLPKDTQLPDDLASAVSESKNRFRQLPQSLKRDEVLGSLGRIKQQSLKQKIRYRSSFLTNVIGNHIPEINIVTDAAVDLRNLYVHGGKSDQKIKKLRKHQIFLTDTLEFVFCASDLVNLGWDIEAWCQKLKVAGHPFCYYLRSYKTNLSELKS